MVLLLAQRVLDLIQESVPFRAVAGDHSPGMSVSGRRDGRWGDLGGIPGVSWGGCGCCDEQAAGDEGCEFHGWAGWYVLLE